MFTEKREKMRKINFDRNFPARGIVRMTKLSTGTTIVTSENQDESNSYKYDTVVSFGNQQIYWNLLSEYNTLQEAQTGHRRYLKLSDEELKSLVKGRY